MDAYKCVVVGDEKAGKTALLDAFVNQIPCTGDENDYSPTVIDHHECRTSTGDSEGVVTLALFDTSGAERGLKLRKCLYPQTKVVLVVFSVFDPNSFNNVKSKWVPELNARCPGVPWVLVGTQTDLRSDNSALAILRAQQSCDPISTAIGEAMAEELEAFRYIECSSVGNMIGVHRVFQEAIFAARIFDAECLRRRENARLANELAAHDPSPTTTMALGAGGGRSLLHSIKSFSHTSKSLLNNARSFAAKRITQNTSSSSMDTADVDHPATCSLTTSHASKKLRFIRSSNTRKHNSSSGQSKPTLSRDELKASIQFVQPTSRAALKRSSIDNQMSIPSEQEDSCCTSPKPKRVSIQLPTKQKPPVVKRKPVIGPKPTVPKRPVLGVYKVGNGDACGKENGTREPPMYVEPQEMTSPRHKYNMDGPIYEEIDDNEWA
eukprot:m.1115944 g.1115944  ORF g.1115944 m.1115944 type:complete len:436 (-) comp24373_c0_seq6:258-1565(-)